MSLVNERKKVILVVSFGTSYEDTRKATIDVIEDMAKECFSDYEIRRAFTSGIIRNKLKERDSIIIDSTEEALRKIKKDGFKEVIVQPLHIIPGIEYDEIRKVVDEYRNKKVFEKLVLGTPLLYEEKDYEISIDAMKEQLPKMSEGQGVVLMGHGTTHSANACYALLQYVLEEKALGNVLIATVEGYPTLDNVVRRLSKKSIKEVTLMPFMLVAGDHAINDMAGDEEDSWKIILEEKGFKCNLYLHGLGENKSVQDIYMKRIRECIER